MFEVHGLRAATVARENARAAALAGQGMQARFWIRVLDTIQQAGPTSPTKPDRKPAARNAK